MPTSTKRKWNGKATATRVVALVMAVLLLGSVLLAAVLSQIY